MDNDPPTLPDTPPRDEETDAGNEDPDNEIVHIPYYPTERAPHIHLEMPFSAHVDIQLYNLLGQKVGTVFNEMMLAGTTEINIRERLRDTLATGKYIYRIQAGEQAMSKSVMIM